MTDLTRYAVKLVYQLPPHPKPASSVLSLRAYSRALAIMQALEQQPGMARTIIAVHVSEEVS